MVVHREESTGFDCGAYYDGAHYDGLNVGVPMMINAVSTGDQSPWLQLMELTMTYWSYVDWLTHGEQYILFRLLWGCAFCTRSLLFSPLLFALSNKVKRYFLSDVLISPLSVISFADFFQHNVLMSNF